MIYYRLEEFIYEIIRIFTGTMVNYEFCQLSP